jgi:primase-polymerase (primpol)-like protein
MLGDGFAGVDWDHCIRDGFISLEASEDLQLLNSYSEVSPSGTGVKAFVLGTLPKGWRKRPEIEMYEAGRFFTFTGRHLVGTPEQVMSRQEELATLHAKYAPPERVERPSKEKTDEPHEYCGHYVQADYSDEEIITRAMKARNGAKFERLWKGDYSDYLKANGKPDQSRADLALCNLLAFWTNDPKTIDRLFRQSGLMRPKWDRAARAGETYGGGTIKRALEGQKDEAA